MKVDIFYFAWVREKTGVAQEVVDLPAGIATVAELIAWLRTRGPEFEQAFANLKIVRAAINQTHVTHEAKLEDAREIAFFPPVTGG